MRRLRRIHAGDLLTEDLINGMIDAANRATLSVTRSCGLLLRSGPEGFALATAIPSFLWAKTTGGVSGGTYPFTQQLVTGAGTWMNGPLTGTAYELNGNTSVPTGTYIQIVKVPTGSWAFMADSC